MLCSTHDPILLAAGILPVMAYPCAWPRCANGAPGETWRQHHLPSSGALSAALATSQPAPPSWTDYQRRKREQGGRIVWVWEWTQHLAESGLTVTRC